MGIDKTKRRAVLVFCMDTLVRAFGDEDLLPAWLDGVPDGCYDDVPQQAFDMIADAYDYAVVGGDEADEFWDALESLFIFTVLRGVWGDAEFVRELVVPGGGLFT